MNGVYTQQSTKKNLYNLNLYNNSVYVYFIFQVFSVSCICGMIASKLLIIKEETNENGVKTTRMAVAALYQTPVQIYKVRFISYVQSVLLQEINV